MRLTKIFSGSLIAGIILFSANVYGADIKINKNNFPDADFRSIVKPYDINKDGKFSKGEIKNIKSLNGTVDGGDDECILTIHSLKGMEYFYNLESFCCCTSGIKKIDFSANKKLKSISMEGATGLTSINIKECKDLEDIYVCSPDLKEIDLSHNEQLKTLAIFGKIGSVNLSNNKKLKELSLDNNGIKTIDLKNNTLLKKINLDMNPIESLDLSNNKKLIKLSVQNCKLNSIDLSKNVKLKEFYCGDDIFNSYTGYKKTYNSIKKLDLSHNKNLVYLYCSYNKIENLDLSHNKKLKAVYAEQNNLKKINIRNLRNIKDVILNNNKLKKINLSGCKNLEWLSISGNKLRKLDLSKNPKLTILYFNNNKKTISNLDLSSNKEMFKLSVRNSKIKKINLSGLERLFEADLRDNKLSKLDLSTNKDIYRLKIARNNFTYLEPGSFYPTEEIMYRMKADNTLEVYSYNPRCKRHIDIIDEIKIKGKMIKITSVADNAYADTEDKFFNEITFGSNITSIGKGAFANCKKIKKITIKSNTITDVGEGAFAGYNKNLVIEVNKGYVEYYKEILKDIFDFNIVTIKEIE